MIYKYMWSIYPTHVSCHGTFSKCRRVSLDDCKQWHSRLGETCYEYEQHRVSKLILERDNYLVHKLEGLVIVTYETDQELPDCKFEIPEDIAKLLPGYHQ